MPEAEPESAVVTSSAAIELDPEVFDGSQAEEEPAAEQPVLTPQMAPMPVMLAAANNPSAIPVVEGPNAAGVTLTFGEENESFAIEVPSAGTYVLHLDKVSGSYFRVGCKVADPAGNDIQGANNYLYAEYDNSWDLYFTAQGAGTYTAVFSDIYYSDIYEEETGDYVPYSGEQVFSLKNSNAEA